MQTYDIPGGTVDLRDKAELNVGHSRAIALATRRLPRRTLLASVPEGDRDPETALEVAVNEATEPAAIDLIGLPVGLTDDDIEAAWAFNDTLLTVYVAAWSIDRPVPKTRDEIAELPSDLYAALNEAVAAHIKPAAGELVDQFTVDAVEDRESPTGA